MARHATFDAKGAVVHIITKLELGGAQKVCLSLVRQLHDRGRNTILISGLQGQLVAWALKELPEVYLLSSLQWNVSLRTFWKEGVGFVSLWWRLRMLKKKYGSLVVHTHSTKAGIMGRWAAWCAGVRAIVHTVHNFGFHPYQRVVAWWVHYVLEFITARITTHYIYVSQENLREGAALLPGAGARGSLIRAAVDWDAFYVPGSVAPTSAADVKRPVVFGSVSCFKPGKNLLSLLSIIADLVHIDGCAVRLEVIGDGAQRKALEASIAHYHLKDIVTLHGWQFAVAPYMRRWDVYVSSSLWEGLPCAIVEARLSHLPVVTYSVGGISEVIIHERNGLLVEPGKEGALYAAMLRMIRDPLLRECCALHADNLHLFNDSVMVQQHDNLYADIA